MNQKDAETVVLNRSHYEYLLGARRQRDALYEQVRFLKRQIDEPNAVADRVDSGVPPLKALREHHGMSVKGLSEATGVNRTRIIKLEAGETTPTFEYLKKLADFFGVTVDDILN